MNVQPSLLLFWEGLATPVALSCWLLFKYGEHRQLSEKTVSPQDYADRQLFQRDYAAVKFLSKWKGLKTGVDTSAVALDKWFAVESSMRMVNTRLILAQQRGFSPRVEAVIFTAQRKIAGLLGDLDVGHVMEFCRWGPGATFSLKGEDATVDDKIREDQVSVTASALPLLKMVIEQDYHWMRSRFGGSLVGSASLLDTSFCVVEGCRVTTVDKDAKTDRVIAIEPTGNCFLQLGVGQYIRKRLKRRGIDLDNQGTNQFLAWLGSLDGSLATVDLSSASDSVSREVVWQLLPYDWACLLDALRSPSAFVNGEWLELEKFSSMGNGFTFELETLLFWAISDAVMEVMGELGAVAVYGDDIILPTQCLATLLEVLDTLGFSPNKEKTFGSGYFRESCGKHYWDGSDVTPVYQKEVLTDIAEDIRYCNRIINLAHRLSGGGPRLDSALKPAWDMAVRSCSWELQYFVPWGDESDDGLKLPLGELLGLDCAHWDPVGGRVKLPVLSFRPTRKYISEADSLLAYWLRRGALGDVSSLRYLERGLPPTRGYVTIRRRGRYAPRRRWFYTYAHNDLSTVDVAWV